MASHQSFLATVLSFSYIGLFPAAPAACRRRPKIPQLHKNRFLRVTPISGPEDECGCYS